MRRTAAALTALLCAASLSGCSEPEPPPADKPTNPTGFSVETINVNGRQVTCITWSDYKKGGLSCDWNPTQDGAK